MQIACSRRISGLINSSLLPPLRRFSPNRIGNGRVASPTRDFRTSQPTRYNDASGNGGPSLLFLAQVVIGIPTAVWTYKCISLVLAQRKLIYLPYIPWGARDDELDPKDPLLKGLQYETPTITSGGEPGFGRRQVELRGILLQKEKVVVNQGKKEEETRRKESKDDAEKEVVMIYNQGNAGTPLMRLPLFNRLLKRSQSLNNCNLTAIISFGPRSYWKSSRRPGPTQQGLLEDYTSMLKYTAERFPGRKIVVYGHSLGASGSLVLMERLLRARDNKDMDMDMNGKLVTRKVPLPDGIVLENAFENIPNLVKAVYPNRWLPYRYLGWAVLDKWDALKASQALSSDERFKRIPILILISDKDELVPKSHGLAISKALTPPAPVTSFSPAPSPSEPLPDSTKSNMNTNTNGTSNGQRSQLFRKTVIIPDALHDTAYTRARWADEVGSFIRSIGLSKKK